ncbi:MAG: N-acetylmuramoyl-L-alanine amidase [Treponema sp.]|nr:N-acetylmuramoyl-L-alanine amidase [Treponema sp.]
MNVGLRRIAVFCILSFFSVWTAVPLGMSSLAERAAKNGMTLYWDPLAQNGVLEKNGHQISFSAGTSFVLEDYKNYVQKEAPLVQNGVLVASDSFFSYVEKFFRGDDSENGFRIGAILIDPGHGGKDPGANQTHTIKGKKVDVREKDITLNVGLKLYKMLKAAYPDKKILMTRNTDVFVSLAQRTEIANSVRLSSNEAILYVSVHVNASLDKKASGYEVWYLSPGYRRQVLNQTVSGDKNVDSILNDMLEEEFTTESILIAKFIMDGVGAQVGSLSNPRGIKAEEWFVVRNANMPSVLIETGFLTNEKEAALLADDSYLQKLSLGIYNGLQAFVTHFERSRGFTGK